MRIDGRTWNELRPVTITIDPSSFAEGSVTISLGRTRVLCTATIEESVPRWMQLQNKAGGWITGEYAMLPRATQQRTPRENNGLGGRTQEIRRLIGRSLRSAINLEKLGPRTVIIDCDVLQADGGTRTAAITGGYVALALALNRLIQSKKISADTIQNSVAAVSVGMVDGSPVLDLCYAEDSRAEVDANIVMDSTGRFIEVQGTAEGQPYSRAELNQMLDLATQGIERLFGVQNEILLPNIQYK